jgi:hypothetical protein
VFRTIAEIEATINRGGLSEEEQYDVWDCLYLVSVRWNPSKPRLRVAGRRAESLGRLPAVWQQGPQGVARGAGQKFW